MALMDIVIGAGIGLAIGLIIVPLCIWIWYKYHETKVRREIKSLISQNKMLMPLDKNDFDIEMWKDKINLDEMEKTLKTLDKKLFNRNNNKEKEVKKNESIV